MNHESITEIESLENQLPRWEKWLYLCYGASFTMFVNALVRSVERSYLKGVFVVSAEELKLMGAVSAFLIPLFNILPLHSMPRGGLWSAGEF